MVAAVIRSVALLAVRLSAAAGTSTACSNVCLFQAEGTGMAGSALVLLSAYHTSGVNLFRLPGMEVLARQLGL